MTNSDHVSTETLADYAEGLLRESEAAAVVAHLDGCAECRAEELLLASLSEILAADDPGPMPAAYAARIDAALAEVALSHPVGSGSAGSDPSGSFHPEGSHGGALDLTPAALAAASSDTGPSADVIDINARRKVVAQGLSRVTTVAASIVLLIGGTVLGLQALNSTGDTTIEPNEIAMPAADPKSTIQPSPFRLIKNPAVEIDKKGKWNPDGSWTNRSGTVINKNGTAVLPVTGQVIKRASKDAKPIEDPARVAGPIPGQPVTSKAAGNGAVTAAQKAPGPVQAGPTVDPAANDPANDPSTPEPRPTAESAGSAPASDNAAPAAVDPGPAAAAEMAEPQAEASSQRGRAQQDAYVEDSRSEYTEENFASKVLTLVEKAQYRANASSVGEAVVEPAESPAVSTTEQPATADSPAASEVQFQEASIATAAPSAAAAPEVTEAPAAGSPAGDRVKARVERCARQLGGQAIAGDTGTWKGEAVTIVVMPDPADSQQVIGRAISGPCSPERPAADNVKHMQYVFLRQ